MKSQDGAVISKAGADGYCARDASNGRAIAASLLGRITHRIWSMPSAEAVIVTSPTTASSRKMATDAWALASIHTSVTPLRKCDAIAAMN